MSITDKIIRNVFSSWAYYFIQFGIGFFLMPFMVYRLGAEVYGIWMLVISFTGYMYIFDFGIRESAVKYVSEFEAKKNTDTLNQVINTSWFVHIIASLLVILIVFIFSNFLDYFLKIDRHLINDFKVCFRIIGINIGVTFFLTIFVGILEGYKRQDIVSSIEIISFILQSILIVFSILRGYGIIAVSIIILFVNIAKQTIRIIFSFKVCPTLKLGFRFLSWKTLKLIFNYSIFLFILQSLINLIGTLPNIILGMFLGPVSITFYSVGSRLTGYLATLLSTTSGVLFPFISGFDAVNDKDRLVKSFIAGSRYCYILVLFFGLTLLIMGKPFIRLWMGEEFASKSYYVLLFSIISFIFSPSAFLINPLLRGLGKLRKISLLTLFEGILGIILSIIFIKNFGLVGVALGFSIPYFINYAIILPFLALHVLGISFKSYVQEVFLRMFFPVMVFCLSLIVLKNKFYPTNYGVLILEILLSGLIYFSVCFGFALKSYERDFFLSRLRLVMGKSLKRTIKIESNG